ncbi:beta-propeller fold lactonase family protein [Acidisphaera sp. S103]|uniref:lactonase family protein n=1 Tax=Acidisphaera sp. S103 TaxID=1747223 RepID=UPI00131EADA5|nr:beta-propeller fold lactonase family protein [Acidisphaera sp. S103]
MAETVVLYASVGPELTRYAVDVDRAELLRQESVTVAENVQYAWPHVSGRYLYVASSNSASGMGPVGNSHHVTAYSVHPESGVLAPHGAPIPLPTRPIHMATDIASTHILAAFSNPGAFRVYRINADATPGDEIQQAEPVDPGIYPHQVRATLDDKHVILVTRGHSAAKGKPEEPGALKVFRYADGLLSDEVSIAPNGGYGFGPRHLDFHPSQPWVYVSLERQNALAMFGIQNGLLSTAPLFTKPTLAAPGVGGVRQLAGTVHVHPNGRFVYAVNRASDTTEFEGAKVFAGGENTLVVYAIDPATGEPTAIQHIDTGGIHCRTFHIDPSGRLLVAAHIMAMSVREGSGIRRIPAGLSVFRITEDGRLHFQRAYEVEVGDKTMFWMGMVTL